MVVAIKKLQCLSLLKDGSRRCSKDATGGTQFCAHHRHVYFESDSDDGTQVKAMSADDDYYEEEKTDDSYEDDDVASEVDAWKASHAAAVAGGGSGARHSSRFAATKTRNNLPRGRAETRLELEFKKNIRKLVADTKEAKKHATTTEYHQTLNAITCLLENVILSGPRV